MKWEYAVYTFANLSIDDLEYLTKTLDAYASKGWELISVDNGFHYFKRPLIEEQTNKEVD